MSSEPYNADGGGLTINGHTYSPETVEEATAFIQRHQAPRQAHNARSAPAASPDLFTDATLRGRFGQTFDGERDVWEALGYDENPDFEDLHAKYQRGDIARRIVDLPAIDTWKKPPTVSDSDGESDTPSDFEATTDQFVHDAFASIARRSDIAAGIGEYGVLFFGFADGAEAFDEAVNASAFTGDPAEDIAYFEIFNQDDIAGWELGKDIGRPLDDPMYNKPVYYDLDFSADGAGEDDVESVHHTRLLHVPADEPIFSNLKAEPRLLSVYNRLEDWEKAIGSAAEAAWHSADRKYHFDIRDGFADIPDDELSGLADEVQKLVHDLQPYVKTMGTDLNVISGEDVNPQGVIDPLKASIAGATGIPQRKLFGSERGDQASTQDRANWFDTIASRQRNFAEAFILRPAIDKLAEFGILPSPAGGMYTVEWPSLFELTAVEESEVQFNRARAARNAMPQGNTDLAPNGIGGVITYLETGEFPEAQPTAPNAADIDESDPRVREYFEELTGDE